MLKLRNKSFETFVIYKTTSPFIYIFGLYLSVVFLCMTQTRGWFSSARLISAPMSCCCLCASQWESRSGLLWLRHLVCFRPHPYGNRRLRRGVVTRGGFPVTSSLRADRLRMERHANRPIRRPARIEAGKVELWCQRPSACCDGVIATFINDWNAKCGIAIGLPVATTWLSTRSINSII